jgi:hypothetical protein
MLGTHTTSSSLPPHQNRSKRQPMCVKVYTGVAVSHCHCPVDFIPSAQSPSAPIYPMSHDQSLLKQRLSSCKALSHTSTSPFPFRYRNSQPKLALTTCPHQLQPDRLQVFQPCQLRPLARKTLHHKLHLAATARSKASCMDGLRRSRYVAQQATPPTCRA